MTSEIPEFECPDCEVFHRLACVQEKQTLALAAELVRTKYALRQVMKLVDQKKFARHIEKIQEKL